MSLARRTELELKPSHNALYTVVIHEWSERLSVYVWICDFCEASFEQLISAIETLHSFL